MSASGERSNPDSPSSVMRSAGMPSGGAHSGSTRGLAPGLERFRAGGLAWNARTGYRAAVEELCRKLDDPGRIEGAVRIKASNVRSVWRMPLSDRIVYVKRYRVHGTLERLKYLVAPPSARREWHAALTLAAHGIEAAEPLAVGIGRKGPWLEDAFFIAGEVPGAPYAEALAGLRSELGGVSVLLRETAALYQRLESAGIVHPDLHAGNLLVRLVGGAPKIALVDLHAIRFPHVATRAARRRVRAKLAHSLWQLLDESEFEEALQLLAPGREAVVRRDVVRAERMRLRSRTRRCLLSSTQFERERAGDWKIWRSREVSVAELLALLARTSEGSPHVARLTVGGEPRDVLVWRRPRPGWLSVWKGLHALGVREVPTWTAHACLHRRRLGRLCEAVLVTEHLPDARPLEQAHPDEALARAACATAERLHRAGLAARAQRLYARRVEAGWQVLAAPQRGQVPDRPVSSAQASRELAALRALTVPDQDAALSR